MANKKHPAKKSTKYTEKEAQDVHEQLDDAFEAVKLAAKDVTLNCISALNNHVTCNTCPACLKRIGGVK